MLIITAPEQELWNQELEVFTTLPAFTIHLEHSLVSLSKWESKFEKPFLSELDKKTSEEMQWYIFFMQNPPGESFENLSRLSIENLQEINKYIDSKQTATTFREETKKTGKSEIITAELVYYWMLSFRIPYEFETWHLNRLFALIRIFSTKQGKPKKMNRSEQVAWQREENARRRAELGTRG